MICTAECLFLAKKYLFSRMLPTRHIVAMREDKLLGPGQFSP